MLKDATTTEVKGAGLPGSCGTAPTLTAADEVYTVRASEPLRQLLAFLSDLWSWVVSPNVQGGVGLSLHALHSS